MDTKIVGGILLIVGTSIGAGMLALPIATAGSGFIGSALLLIACWAVMTFSAFLMLEVNLWLPSRTNVISMAHATLGKYGRITAWVSYVLLLYALLAAYIAGGSALFHDLFELIHYHSPTWIDSITFVAVLGYVVYCGMKPVDYVNRGLMLIKFGSLFLLILAALPFIDLSKLTKGQPALLTSTVTVMITSFGFGNLVPSLRSYFDGDVRKLRITILIGSLIPLVCYLAWEFAILGTLPLQGEQGLTQLMQTGGSTSELTQSLSYHLHNTSVTSFTHIFTAICVLTAFLGVALSLSDFLSDGLKIEKAGKGKWIIFAITFLPSLLIVLFYPSIFVKALHYAGIFATVLIVLLPALMVWRGRYHKKISAISTGHYAVFGRNALLVIGLIGIACTIICLGLIQL